MVDSGGEGRDRSAHTLDRRAFLLGAVALPAGAAALARQTAPQDGDPSAALSSARRGWWAYAGDNRATRYSPLDRIDRGNVSGLRVAWQWSSPDEAIAAANPDVAVGEFQATPIHVNGVLYLSTAMSQVVALDARTGATVWVHDPGTWKVKRPTTKGFMTRGVAWWTDGREQRLFFATGDARLLALDARTGQRIAGFGESGEVNLKVVGLERPIVGSSELYGQTSPPLVCSDVVVVGSYISDRTRTGAAPPGDVRGFDARTGALRWVFHTIPRPGEPGHDTWENGSWSSMGNTNVWAPMSADDELGYVYLPVSTPTHNFSGVDRPGAGLFGESLVCLEAATGRLVWHFQIVHHGIWDYDPPCAPVLVDIEVGGRRVAAVVQATKQGFCFVFDRRTGEPVWPIEERPVPQSKLPGEKTWPTQPFPTRPPPFDRQGVIVDDVLDFTPELRREGLAILEGYDYGPLYTPIGERPTILMPGWVGGANWKGVAFDPETAILYVPSQTLPLAFGAGSAAAVAGARDAEQALADGGAGLVTGPDGLPLFKPPYNRLTAIDLGRGELSWTAPLGDGPRRHPRIAHLDLGPLGGGGRADAMVTKTLVISFDAAGRGSGGEMSYMRAFDKRSGEQVAAVEIPERAVGAAMTYEIDGRQYIAYASGYRRWSHRLYALALP
jgi:quinoprotein glucose dehydrogenase